VRTSAGIRTLSVGVLVAFSVAVTAADWYPSQWGKDDTLGAANLITDGSVAGGLRLVRRGEGCEL
jgi:hypothetical protein